jgi:hypothetical protein
MNEKGLFIDFNAVGTGTGWKADPDKPDLADDPTDYLLSRFVAVDEVVEFFKTNDVDLNGGMFVVANAMGRSAVVEWANGQLQVHPYSFDGYPWIGRQLGDVKLRNIIDENGIQEGLRVFPLLKEQKRTYPRYVFQDWVIKSAAFH